MKTKTTFSQLYNFPGFRARARFKCGVFKDPKARIVDLFRRQKKRFAPAVSAHPGAFTIADYIGSGIWLPGIIEFTWNSSIDAWLADGVRP